MLSSIEVAGQKQNVVTKTQLTEFAVKSVTLTLLFMEMALVDTKFDILGVAYELVSVSPNYTNTNGAIPAADLTKISKRATDPKVDIDWNFVDYFVEDWYTSDALRADQQHQIQGSSLGSNTPL